MLNADPALSLTSQWANQFTYQFYTLSQDSITLAVGAQATFNFNLDSNVEFLIEQVQLQADNQAGNTIHVGMQLSDSNGRFYTQGFLGTNYFSNSGSGNAERPINMNIPFRGNTVLRITLKNFAAVSATNLILSIIGRRNYSYWSFFNTMNVNPASQGYAAERSPTEVLNGVYDM